MLNSLLLFFSFAIFFVCSSFCLCFCFQCYDKLVASLRQGNQAMVFVHSRKNTARLAEYLVERAAARQEAHLFQAETNATSSALYRQELQKCRSGQLKALLPRG